MGSPHHPRPDELRLPQRIVAIRDSRFHQNRLGGVVHLRGDKAHPRVGKNFPLAVENLHRQVHLQLRRALDRDIHIRFQAPGLIDRRQYAKSS